MDKREGIGGVNVAAVCTVFFVAVVMVRGTAVDFGRRSVRQRLVAAFVVVELEGVREIAPRVVNVRVRLEVDFLVILNFITTKIRNLNQIVCGKIGTNRRLLAKKVDWDWSGEWQILASLRGFSTSASEQRERARSLSNSQ